MWSEISSASPLARQSGLGKPHGQAFFWKQGCRQGSLAAGRASFSNCFGHTDPKGGQAPDAGANIGRCSWHWHTIDRPTHPWWFPLLLNPPRGGRDGHIAVNGSDWPQRIYSKLTSSIWLHQSRRPEARKGGGAGGRPRSDGLKQGNHIEGVVRLSFAHFVSLAGGGP